MHFLSTRAAWTLWFSLRRPLTMRWHVCYASGARGCAVLMVVFWLLSVGAGATPLIDALHDDNPTSTTTQQQAPLWRYPFSQASFQTIDPNGKIYNNIITGSVSDADGILWLTSQNGLVSYDGYQFQQIAVQSTLTATPSSDYLTAISLHPDGHLWLLSINKGVYRYDPKQQQLQHFGHSDTAQGSAPLLSDQPRGIGIDRQGQVWIGHDDGIDILDAQGQRIAQVMLPATIRGSVYCFWPLSDGRMLVGGSFGILQMDQQGHSHPLLTGVDVRDIDRDSSAMYWLSTREGLWRWDGVHAPHSPQGLAPEHNKAYFRQSVISDQGLVFAASYGAGLYVFDSQNGQFLRQFSHDQSIATSLSFDELGTVVLGANQQLWIGAWGGGLQRLDLRYLQTFASIRYSMKDNSGLSYASVRSVLELDDGRWLFGTTGRGVDIFDPTRGRSGTISQQQLGLGSDAVGALGKDGVGRVFAAGTANNLYLLDLVQLHSQAVPLPELNGSPIARMLRLERGPDQGRLLLGASKNLCLLRLDLSGCDTITRVTANQTTTSTQPRPPHDSITALYQDSHGNVWIGGHNGLWRARAGARSTDHFDHANAGLSDNYVLGISEHANGDLLLVTATGFDRLANPNTAQPSANSISSLISTYQLSHRMPGGNMVRVGNTLYSATTALDLQGTGITEFTHAEGAYVGTVWLGAFMKTSDQLLVFGGSQGVLLFNPAQLPQKIAHSRVIARRLLLQGVETGLARAGASLQLSGSAPDFALQVAAPDLVYAAQVRYRYRLQGFDDTWQALDSDSRWVRFTNLPPGDYQLEVEGSYDRLRGTIEPLRLAVHVQPALWQTWYARLLVLLVALLALRWLFRWRVQQLQQQAQQLEQLVEQRTHQLDTINSIGRHFTSNLALEAVFDDIYQQIQQLARVDSFGIGLVDPERRCIRFEYAVQQQVRYAPYERPLERAEQLAVFCVTHNRSILIQDYAKEYHFYHPTMDQSQHRLVDGSSGMVAQSMVYVPLHQQQRVIGVIAMQSFVTHSYSSLDVSMLETLSSYAAIALGNAHAHQQLAISMTALQQAQKQLVMQEKMASLGQLVAGVAHEVNTPLGVAYTAVSVLDDKLQQLKQQVSSNTLRRHDLDQYLEHSSASLALVLPNLHRAAQLIQQFKLVAANQVVAEPEAVELLDICSQMLAVIGAQARANNITLVLATKTPLQLHTNRPALTQVLLILLQNAVDHAFETNRPANPCIQLQFERLPDGAICLRCLDNGSGIATPYQDKIFEPFFTTKRPQGFTGLGLSIAYNLTHQQLAATLTYHSNASGGSVFELRWPPS